MRTPHHGHLPLHVDRDAEISLTAQIVDQVTTAIDIGVVVHGERMPSTRTLALALGVSRSVTNAAYLELFARGDLAMVAGSGTYVARPDNGRDERNQQPDNKIAAPVVQVDLSPREFSSLCLPRSVWRAAWNVASCRPQETPPPLGLDDLRAAIARHLLKTRAVRCAPSQIVVTSGTRHAVELAIRIASKPGHGVIVDELSEVEWSWALHKYSRRPVSPRIQIVPAPELAILGWRGPRAAVDHLDDKHRTVLHVASSVELSGTTGNTLPPRDNTVLDEIAHAGGFAHLFSSDLAIGYLMLPSRLLPAAEHAVTSSSEQPPVMVQRVALELLRSDVMTHCTGRSAQLLAERQRQLRELIAELDVGWTLRVISGHAAVIDVARGVDLAEVVEGCARQGVVLPSVNRSGAVGDRRWPHAESLVIGLMQPPPQLFAEVLRTVAESIASSRRSSAA